MQLGLTTKVSYQLTLKMQDKITFHMKIYFSFYQPDFNKIFLKNDDAATAIVAFICAGPHFFTPYNYLLYMYAQQKQLFI